MAYRIYLDGVLLPVAPQKISVKVNGKNETVTLINEGEANILKAAGLSDVELEFLLPGVKYPFATYTDGFQPAQYFLNKLESLKVGKKPFQYIVTRTDPQGKRSYDSNMTVSMENYTITEDAGNGYDISVKVSLKQYREFTTKVCTIDILLPKPQAVTKTVRAVSANAPSGGSYTVVKGDSLYKIAQKHYGSGSKWQTIYNANKGTIGGNPNLIYPGQNLTIPG